MTSLQRVAGLYDDLCHLERRFRSEHNYPVHKFLHQDKLGYEDVYAWMVGEQHIMQEGDLLDAGCGVGFGSRLIAENTQNQVTGISLSQAEIHRAQQMVLGDKVNHRLKFAVRAFDAVTPDTLDQIVAVESLKHSLDIPHTLNQWRHAMRPGGRLIIVDDFFDGDEYASPAKSLCANWHLNTLLAQQHILSTFSDYDIEFIDLTSAMRMPSRFSAKIKELAYKALAKIRPAHKGAQAFLGGCALDTLYLQGHMKYLALVITKPLPRVSNTKDDMHGLH